MCARKCLIRQFALAFVLVLMFATCSAASAQSVWQKMKQTVLQQQCQQGIKKACQALAELNQKIGQQPQQGQPGGTSQGQQPGQPAPPSAGRGRHDAGSGDDQSGPVHPPHGTKVEETVLAPIAPGAKFFVSPHGVHVATVETSGSRAVMYYDGTPGPKFDEMLGGQSGQISETAVAFSPDGKRYAYCARSGNEWVIMVDGKEYMRGSESEEGRLTGRNCLVGFTSNSQHVFVASYVVKSTSKGGTYTRFFFDGQQSPLLSYSPTSSGQYLNGIQVVFSPDGNHYAYVATDPNDEQKWALIVDGKVAPYRGGALQWSADSRHLYSTINHPGPTGYVEAMLDGKPFMRADQLRLHVAPAGNMVVAEVEAGDHTPTPMKFLVVDGKKVPGTEIVHQRGQDIDQVTFSPDGKHYAARFTTAQNHQYVFVDGKRGQDYQTVDEFHFTADSAKLTYSAFTNNKPYVVFGDQESEACHPGQSNPGVDVHPGLAIAPVGGRAGTICGLTGGPPAVYLDGKTMALPNGAVEGSYFRFSPDGQHYAYRAGFQGGALRLVVDGVVQMNSNLGSGGNPRGPYVFSPDSQHIAIDSLPPTSGGEYASGLFLDGKYIPGQATPRLVKLTFTSDSKHIVWAQPVPSRNALRIFVDGKAVAEADEAVAPDTRENWWDMAPDGSLFVLVQDQNNLKRITITPSAETSVAALGGGGALTAKRDE